MFTGFSNKEVVEDPEQQSQKPDNRRPGVSQRSQAEKTAHACLRSVFTKHNNIMYIHIFINALGVRWRERPPWKYFDS